MDLLRLLSASHRLASLRRFSMEQLSHPESVLEHTGFVALVSLALVEEANAIIRRRRGAELNVALVLCRALVHDVDELVTGDIPRPTKYSTPMASELFDEIKRTSLDKITSEIFDSMTAFSSLLRAQHHLAKDDQEGMIVAIADVIAVVYMVWREVLLRGNMSMTRQAFTVVSQIDALRGRSIVRSISEAGDFLDRVLLQARSIAVAASEKDDPIHASIRED